MKCLASPTLGPVSATFSWVTSWAQVSASSRPSLEATASIQPPHSGLRGPSEHPSGRPLPIHGEEPEGCRLQVLLGSVPLASLTPAPGTWRAG